MRTCKRSHPHEVDGYCDGSVRHLITQLQSTITTQSAAIAAKDEALGKAVEVLDRLHKWAFDFTEDGYRAPMPWQDVSAALTACREAMTTTRLDRASTETEAPR